VAALTVDEIEAARGVTPGCGEVIHLDHVAVDHALGWGIERIEATVTESADSSRWDVERRGRPELLRISVHYTTTMDELTAAVDVLAGAIRGR